MKRLCLIFVLLLFNTNHSLNDTRYYVAVIYQNQQCYEEFMSKEDFIKLVDCFYEDSDLESLFITRDICAIPR